MSILKTTIVLVSCCLLCAGGAQVANAQLSELDKAIEQDRQAIRALEFKKGITDYDAESEKMAATIRDKWATRNREAYVQLVLELCGLISSGQFGETRRHGLNRKYALALLQNPDAVPVETEIRLTGHVGSDTTLPSGPQGQDWIERRRVDVKAHLHAWKRLNDGIDPNWDPKDRPMFHPPLPKGVNGPSGVAPEAIKDPTLRAEYERAIALNSAKAKRFNEQYSRRNLRKSYTRQIERLITNSYSKPPLDENEMEEFLKTFVSDPAFANQLRTAVSLKIAEKARHDFDLLPTTGPFRGHPSVVPGRTKKATRIR